MRWRITFSSPANAPPSFRSQYVTPSGLKCLYNGTGTVQEVFIVSKDGKAVEAWLVKEGIVDE